MDPAVAQVVGLLDAEERELRWAAAKVLGALRPDEADEVVPALARTLRSDDVRLKEAALEAIAALGGGAVYEDVTALLEEPGDVGRRAMDVLVGIDGVLRKLKGRFEDVGQTGRRRILAIAARKRGAEGMDLIVKALQAGHAEEVRGMLRRFGGELAEAPGRDRKALRRRLDKFLASAAARRDADAAGAAVELLARVEGEHAQEELVAFAGPEYPALVRKRAIQALGEMARARPLADDVLSRLIALLEDADFADVVRPCIAALETARLGAAHVDPLLKYVQSDDPALRRFAVTALGQVDSPRASKALLAILAGDNPDLQRRAAVSLSKQTEAAPLVVDAVSGAPDAQTAWILARILQPHAATLRPGQVEKLAKAAASWMEKGDPRAEALVMILRDHHGARLAEACVRRVKRLRRNRRAGEMINLIRPLARDGVSLPADVRYELAIAEIMRGPKDVVRAVRLDHPGLELLETLAQESDFALQTKLKRDKSVLTPEEFYLIGCHFAERSYADRAFGGELLRWLVQNFPEESSAHAAEHKLVMEGFPPPPKPRAKKKKKPTKKKAATKAPAAGKKAKARTKAPARKKAKKAPPKKAAQKTASKKAGKKTAGKKAAGKKTAKKGAGKKTKKAAGKTAKKGAVKVSRKKTAKRSASGGKTKKVTKRSAKRSR